MGIIPKLKQKLVACLTGILLVAASSCDFHLGPPPPPATLAVCPTNESQSTSSILGPLGGIVSLGGTSVDVPLGALLSATSIDLTIPASQYMEIGVTANGGHFFFQQPIAITIDYSRCSATVQAKALSVWNIDPNSKSLLRNMGGIDNKLTHQITFTTSHFSGYALAF